MNKLIIMIIRAKRCLIVEKITLGLYDINIF